MIKHICFDLDGTLVDSHKTILNATLETLKDLNITESIKEDDFRIRIGHHFRDIFKDLRIEVADVEHFINIYKRYYFSFIKESELYPYAEKTLSDLKDQGYLISLLTTKTQDQAEKILEYFNFSEYFDLIMGRRINIAVKPDPEPLIKICEILNVKTAETLMVGDTELDIACGRNAGSLTCAVMYGYREIGKLKNEKADYYINSLTELTSLLSKENIIN